MINKISLENFKGFKDLKNVKLKPITILAGTNSCGKSSILQSILLLKQTIESKAFNQTLLLNGRFVHLGNFENIIYGKESSKSVKLGISYIVKKEKFSSEIIGTLPFHFIFRHLLTEESFDLPKAEYQINYYVWIKNIENSKSKSYIKPTIVEKVELDIKIKTNENKEFSESYFKAELTEDKDIYSCSWKLPNDRGNKQEDKFLKGKDKFKIKFLNLIPTSFEVDNPKSYNKNHDIDIYFYVLDSLIKHIFSSVTYVGPLREEPSRRYIYEDEVIEIGVKGENAAYIFLSEFDKRIDNVHFFSEDENKFYKENQTTLGDSVNKWNDLFKIKNFKAEPSQEVIRLNLDSSNNENTRVNIADVGFGVSQIFPIILEGLRMKKDATMLLEQPEIHLHPKIQMQLADYFISLALSQKNLIIETHSEHIINRLVRRIVEDSDFNLNEYIGIYFIEPTANGSKFTPININEISGIINWPTDFFDQTANEQEKIILASIKNRKEQK
ncbi:AAA family ATPase [uncultured Aquimarina sp.]|uniref:AAA family ATPase n=1 Tax=uncultured Aquimarina sp. TaxID=575652 RepID=UPI00262E50F5|nr:AAA family ATPase [uncultured Aquimarina sp.]